MWFKIKPVFIGIFYLPFHSSFWYLLSLMVHFPLSANCLTHNLPFGYSTRWKASSYNQQKTQNLKFSTLLHSCFKPFTTLHLTCNRSGFQDMIPNPFFSCLPWLWMPPWQFSSKFCQIFSLFYLKNNKIQSSFLLILLNCYFKIDKWVCILEKSKLTKT